MTPETVAALALDILRERGWYQGDHEGLDGAVCVEAALNVAAGFQPSYGGACYPENAYAACRRVAEVPSLSGWNDDPRTTFEDVQLVLKRVANGEGVEP